MALCRWMELSLPTRDPVTLLNCLPPGPGRFLLESGAAGPADVRRHSFLGAEPFATLISRGRSCTIHEEGRTRILEADPLVVLQSLLNRFRVPAPADLPGFPGGAVGYFSYDLGRQIERLPERAADDLHLPDIHLAFYDLILAVDQESGAVSLITGAPDGREAEAPAKASRWARALKQAPAALPQQGAPPQAGPVRSSLTREQYLKVVRRALAYIGDGDIYQVNLAQRFTCPYPGNGWQLYQRLRAVNPAPFAAFLEMGSWQVVSGSPERLITVTGERIETRPIKGTRPRGRSEQEDQQQAAELLASEKDAAELLMIVDLQRNDLGRVCRYGSVCVPDLRRLEATPNVWHTVATVEGRLRPGVGAAEILRATFPGGSITGAPKVRAMEIIEELEPVRRGVYTGAIGYIGLDGRIDLNIAIRTAVVRDGSAHFHAGGGIVADSDPALEWAESIAKGRGIARALGVQLDDLP